jgi:type VI secretion system secreted protein VgrG
MVNYSQKNRALQVATPLAKDTLLGIAFRGTEQISGLFSFEVDLIAENSSVIDFSKLVGNDISVAIATPGKGDEPDLRYISGICSCFSQGKRNEEFTFYYAEVVPKIWVLTRRAQSRIFQQKSVPDILKEVLEGFDSDFQLHGQYEPREYCVQYRETDFDFASRLMEEEGIFYFFTHNQKGHKIVLADTPTSHMDVPGLAVARYGMIEGGARKADHILEWRKTQTIRSSRYSLWDHSFQQPKQNLEANAKIMPSVHAGSVEHKLNGKVTAPLEIYEFPGGYAVRFDGVNSSGGEQPDRLRKIFAENERTAKVRIQAEASDSLKIVGSSSCQNFTAGHKFRLERHFDADGDYVLVSVAHKASMENAYTSVPGSGELSYANSFTSIPLELPFRPKRKTVKPFVQGVQHAVVTGPPGEEIFTDKYGRVKVQFYWDRHGKKDANSSCWLRVAQTWAGKNWGSVQIPRIGQEVIVAFVEGNPDEPVIVGSVYNPETMPPYDLPGKKVVSGFKSNTHKGKGYNEMSMDDTAGNEKITIHGQYDMNTTVEHDQTNTVHGKMTETIDKDTTIHITQGKLEHKVETGTALYEVKDALTEKYHNTQDTTVKGNITITSETGDIVLHTGASKIKLTNAGLIEIHGKNIVVIGDTDMKQSAPKLEVTGGQEAKFGVGNQNLVCDVAKTAVSGAAINASAVGMHEITGGLVKIN